MTDPTCSSCGQHLGAVDDHDEEQCAIDKRRETYRRGAAAARAELAAARAAHTPTKETT